MKTTSQPRFCFFMKAGSKTSLSSANRCCLATRCWCFEGGVITGRGALHPNPNLDAHSRFKPILQNSGKMPQTADWAPQHRHL